MKKISKAVLPVAFVAGTLFAIVGAYIRITDGFSSEPFLVTALVATFLFMLAGIWEIAHSEKYSSSEKTMWVAGFIALPWLCCLYYLIVAKRSRFRFQY